MIGGITPLNTLCEALYFLTIISVYFSKYSYLYGCFTYKEIETRINNKLKFDNFDNQKIFMEYSQDFFLRTSNIIESISAGRNVFLEQKENLKKFHSFLIDFIISLNKNNTLSKFPVIIKYLMDIDFCLKYFFHFIFAVASPYIKHYKNYPGYLVNSFLDKESKFLMIILVWIQLKKKL